MQKSNMPTIFNVKQKYICFTLILFVIVFAGILCYLNIQKPTIQSSKNYVEIYSPLQYSQKFTYKEEDALDFFTLYMYKCTSSLDETSKQNLQNVRNLLHKKIDKNGKIVFNYKSNLNETEYLALKKLRKCQKVSFSHMKPQDIRYLKNAFKKMTTEMIIEVYTGNKLAFMNHE